MKKIIKKIVYFLSLSITKFFLLFLFLILLFSLVILITEKNNSDINNFFDSLWFIIVSLTTTGYGDIIPSTNNGKLITLIAILAGIILTAIITGELASIIIEIREKRGKGLMNFSKKKNHIIICGWKNDFANFLKELINKNENLNISDIVLINNEQLENIQSILADPFLSSINYVHGEYFDEGVLIRGGIINAKKVLILADDTGRYSQSEIDSKNVMAVLTIEKINKNIYICAEIFDPKFKKYLQQSHCDEIILSKDFSKNIIINSISESGFSNIIQEFINPNKDTRLKTEIIDEKFIGKIFLELFNYYLEKNIILIGILENIGNFYIRKTEAINEAQKTPDISKLVENLKLIKKLKANEPILNPPKDYIIKTKSSAIVLKRV